MATRKSTIYIQGLENKTSTCHFPTETFNETPISELKQAVQVITGIELDRQILMYIGRTLETVRGDREMTFGDYSLRDKSNIILVIRLPGGGPSFLTLRFADVSSKDSFKKVDLTTGGPKWLTVTPGINFEGTCKYRSCKAKNEIVIIQKGFYDSTGGTCMLNSEITQLECPMCKQELNKNEVNGVGVYEGKLEVKSKIEGSSVKVVKIEARDKFLYAGCMDDSDKVTYEYITLIVKRF